MQTASIPRSHRMTRLGRRLAAILMMLTVGYGAVAAEAASRPADSPTKRKVIIDQDAFGPGGSNMQAILMILQAPDVEVLGITIPSGDGWRDEEVAHTLRLLEIAQRTEIPVYAGSSFPLVNTQERTRRWEQLYGKLVYKGAWTEVWPHQGAVRRSPYHADPYFVPKSPAGEPTIHAAAGTAAEFLSRKVHEFPGQVTIFAAGPLTNVALAARLDPQFAGLARELVFMGGSFNPRSSGNAFAAEYANSPRREFNMRWDPEAASIVLHEPWKKITELPIDPTTKTLFTPQLQQQVAAGKAPFAGYIAQFGQQFPMWDELAAGVWLDPSIVAHEETLLVDVDTAFTASYGDILSWPVGAGPGLGERPVDVVFDVDVPKFERQVVALLSSPTPPH